MEKSVVKMHDFYNFKANAPVYQIEFGWYVKEKWKAQGWTNDDTVFSDLFGFDQAAKHYLGNGGWCTAPLNPYFEEKVLSETDEYEMVQDAVGRKLLCFKGRRSGFMPSYLEHPVKDIQTWEENIKWRMDPGSEERYTDLEDRMAKAKEFVKRDFIICQNIVGGYMYLRSLIGPEDVMYKFYDDPKLIHKCMESWLEVEDKLCETHQKYLTFDELYLGEDICYNHGPLISPDMIKEFLFPYYSQLISNVKRRQMDKARKLHIQIDTDGFSVPVIDLYKSIGMDYMSPFEVASGCDVVEVRKKHPDLLIAGGFDKRIIAAGKDAIDREVDRIMPFMVRYGGYIPTCDHGVPEEVEFMDYLHYRNRMREFA
ncbi:MAG: uroporphyrinogen decarboxylase family protein [Clostridia bacterium]